MSEGGTGAIPRTKDPHEDKYPHYYSGEPSAHIWSTLVYSDEITLDSGILGVTFHDGNVSVDIEADDELTKMGMSLEITPEDARKVALSLLLSADIAEKGDSE